MNPTFTKSNFLHGNQLHSNLEYQDVNLEVQSLMSNIIEDDLNNHKKKAAKTCIVDREKISSSGQKTDLTKKSDNMYTVFRCLVSLVVKAPIQRWLPCDAAVPAAPWRRIIANALAGETPAPQTAPIALLQFEITQVDPQPRLPLGHQSG
jgi:hypothetical protein